MSLDLTAYQFQCKDCLGYKIAEERTKRNLEVSTWESQTGIKMSEIAALTEAEWDGLPRVPQWERSLEDPVLHAELEPFIEGATAVVRSTEGISVVSCLDCDCVLFTHSEPSD